MVEIVQAPFFLMLLDLLQPLSFIEEGRFRNRGNFEKWNLYSS